MCAFHAHRQQRLLDQKLDVLGTFRNSLLTSAPWDSIIEFATSDKYCGKRLYPRQETLLRLIFLETEQMTQYDLDTIDEWSRGFKKRKDVFGVQPDVWDRVQYLKDRGYRRFPHILSVLGRRASKGMIGGVLGAEQIAYFYSLDDWQSHYGIDAGQDGYLSVVATNQSQAQRFQFADIRRTVENCKYLQPNISTSKESYFSIRTPADVRQIAELKGAGIVVEREIATLRAIALSSNSSSGRGAVGFANFFDEFAFMVQGTGSTKSGEEIYEAWQPSLDQFGRDALTYIPSSPFTKIGKFFELYKQGSVLMESYTEKHGKTMRLETEQSLNIDAEGEIEELTADPEMLVFQGPSWILYQDWERGPELVGVRFKRPVQPDLTSEVQQRRQKRNPEKFKVERLGQFAEVQDAYLDPDKVDEMFVHPDWRDPLEPQDYGRFDRTYRIHCDPGRCLVGDTYINTDRGMVKIVQVEVGDEVVTRDGTDSVVEWVPNGIKEVYKLTLRGGWEIRATGNHPVWTERGWVPLQELQSDDKVQVKVGANLWPQNYVEVPSVRMPKRCNGRICFPTNTVDEKMGRLFGYIAAEGSIQDTMLTITSHVDEKLVDEVSSLIRDLFGIEPSWERIKGNARTAGWGNNNLMLILQALGFPLNEHCRQKVIPWSILQSPKSVVAQFISAYFCGDGCVSASHHKDRSVSVSSASGELIKQIQILLGNFGIHSSQYSGWRATGWAGSAKTEYWKLSIRGKSLERFRNEIGFLPDFHEKVMRLDYLADLPHAADPSEFHAVKSLVADGREPTYDLSMQSDHHNFLANGVVCHNTNANFAVAVGHLEDSPPDEKGDVWPHVIIDYLKVWKPGDYPDHTVDYVQIQEELDSLLTRFPSTTKISFDQWNSASFLANIRRDFSPNIRVVEEVFTDRTNQTRCERFKSALNLGWVHSYLDHFGEDGTSLLETECKFLTEKNGKVIKQDFGPCTTKDLFDSVCVVTTDLLHHALDRWVAAVATAGSYGSSDISGLKSGREFERIGAMNGDYRGNIARELLQRQSIDRTRDRMRMTREPGFPTRGRVTDPTRKRFR